MNIPSIELKKHLENICPNLTNYFGPNEKKWEEIKEKYNKRVIVNAKKFKTQDPFTIKTTIYDLVLATLKGNFAVNYFLKHIDKISKNLYDNLPNSFHDSLKKSILGIFENFGDVESKYLDKVGELAILERIILNSDFKLHKIEHKLPNGQSFDFSFTRKVAPEIVVLLEVYNIHIRSEKLETNDKFKKFIETRVIKKLQKKLNNIQSNNGNEYYLVPLVWGKIDDLIRYHNIFSELKKDTIIPETMAFLQSTDGTNFYSFELDSINRIIEKYSKHHNINL